MSDRAKFFDEVFQHEIKRGQSIHESLKAALDACDQRAEMLFGSPQNMLEFRDEINSKYQLLEAKDFRTPFGFCVLLIDKGSVEDVTEWLKTDKNFELF